MWTIHRTWVEIVLMVALLFHLFTLGWFCGMRFARRTMVRGRGEHE